MAALGFALTAAWMIVFPMQMFRLALAVIWLDLACMLYCADRLARERPRSAGLIWAAWLPLSLHSGWLALAAFLILLLACNARMRGNLPLALAGAWGLVGVHVEQSARTSPVPGRWRWSRLAPPACWWRRRCGLQGRQVS